MDTYPDIDGMVDWVSFYKEYIRTPVTPAGIDKMHAHCPFPGHEDRNESFWFNTKNGCWKCEAGCGQGNATTFIARMEGVSNGDAYKKLCEKAGVSMRARADTYTLREYSLEKRLPIEFLTSLGVKDGYKNKYVEIPYKDEHGRVVSARKRMPPGSEPRFLWRKGDKPILYGLWRMEEIRAAKYTVLVEGESDTQTLWHIGIAALGLPGAGNFNVDSAKHLLDIPVLYLHIEPDRGGRLAKRKVSQALLDAGYKGELRPWSCVAIDKGCKDPSAIYIQLGDGAYEAILNTMRQAQTMNLEQGAMVDLDGLEDAPVKLRTPAGYEITNDGIFKIDEKTGDMGAEPFCWTPMFISRILTDEIGETKLELVFRRAGKPGNWTTLRAMRNVFASSRTIIALANREINIHSENASDIVKFLAAQERANMDLIPRVKRVSHYGWVGEKHFVPFASGDVELDSEGFGGFDNVGKACGTLVDWVDAMRPNRQRSLFRFILAASFAAPLLHVLGQRIFMVYNWGDSKGGKTAALMAALSAWGDPEDLRVSFNATKVALERTVGFFSDLPVGLNERQLAGSKQEFVENLVYMLAEGKGKGRGNKDGGLQQQATWRTVVIANGEESLSGESTQTGVVTRALEVYGKPFDNEEDASKMYGVVAANHGCAGAEFIRRLLESDKPKLRQTFQEILTKLIGREHAGVRGHAPSIATVCVADYLIDQWLFGHSAQTAMNGALGMASDVFGMMDAVDDGDVNQKAYEFLLDWINSHKRQFTDGFTGAERYGMFGGSALTENIISGAAVLDEVYIFPSILDRALKEHGYAPKKVRRWLAENERIGVTEQSDGRVIDTVQRRLGGKRVWMIRFLLTDDDKHDKQQCAPATTPKHTPIPAQSRFDVVDEPDNPF